MTLVEFIGTYGYAAVLVGALLQTGSVLLLAGFAAQQGHLSLELVLLAGFIGGAAGDQGFFWIGRRWSGLLQRAPRIRVPMLRVAALLRRWEGALVFGVRFLYGLRVAGPIAMGALGVDARRFAFFNVLGAAVWAVLFGELGYLLGHGIESLLGEIEDYENAILWGTFATVTLLVLGRLLYRAWRARAAPRP